MQRVLSLIYDFLLQKTIDNLDQSSQSRRGRLSRRAKNKAEGSLAKIHLLTTTSLLALAQTSGIIIIDSGENVIGLVTKAPPFSDPFNLNDPCHILETEIKDVDTTTLSKKALHNIPLIHFHALIAP